MVADVRTNLPDFVRDLQRMSRLVRNRAVRRAASSAGAIFRRFARAEAPVRSGVLRRAIYLSRLRGARRDEVGYSVRIRQGKRGKGVDGYYGRFVIFGHLVRQPGKVIQGGARSKALQRARLRAAGAGFVPPNDFLDRAFRSGGSAALAEFNRRMEVEIAKVDAQV